MAGKKGKRNIKGMRNRRKGGAEPAPDGFDRSSADTLASLLDVWIRRMEERAYSPKSLEMNEWSLRNFLSWCSTRDLTRPDEITKPILESYQRWLFRYKKTNGKSLGVTTQRNRIGAVQRYFAWLCKENILLANPASELELPRKPAKLLPRALSRDEIEALFSVPDPADTLGLRDRCILEIFYSCALRRAELVNLNVEDVDLCRGVLTVIKGKGGKSRVVPLGERTVNWVTRYLEESRPHLEIDQNEKALFLSGYGTRFSTSYVGKWVKRTMQGVGIEKTGSCHLLRHSCATHMVENGAGISFVSQLLGHSNLDSTSVYTQMNILQLREVHARTHPHAK